MEILDKRFDILERVSFFVANLDEGVYIMGTNKYGSSIRSWLNSRKIKVHAFINDYSQEAAFDNLPVVKANEIKKNKNLINCVIEGRTIEAQEKLLSLKPKQVIDYLALQLAFPDELIPIDFLSDTDSILRDLPLYDQLYNNLEDAISKETLVKLLNFRLNRDIENLRGFKFNIQEQYFEPFISLKDRPVFIDGGGYDGETTLNFIRLYPEYETVYFFEPNQQIIPKAKSNLNNIEKVKILEKGLWSGTQVLYFDGSKGGASNISLSGNSSIDTVSLDDVITDKADFIKLDIEGAEIEALKGAKNIIIKNKPVLAICVYHSQTDFIDIPKLISTYRQDYKIYLRHYTQGLFETVMFFV